MKIKDIETRKQTIIAEQREMLNKLEAERRDDFSAEEQVKYDRMDAEFDALAERQERAEQSEFKANHADGYIFRSLDLGGGRRQPVQTFVNDNLEEYRAMGEYFQGTPGQEIRLLQADVDLSGGMLVAPVSITADIIAERDQVFIYALSNKMRVPKAESVGVPILESDLSDASFTSEVDEASLDSSAQFTRRQLYPKRLVKAIKVSRHLLNIATPDLGMFVTQRLSYKFNITLENEFLNGDGSNILGIFTTDAQGVSSSRNVSTGNTTTAIKADNLIETLYNLKGQYISSRNCRWIFHRTALKMIRKLKDGEGQFLWQAGIGQDRPSTILGIPYILSEYAPNTFTTGLRVGCICDLSYYGIAETTNISFETLTEKYALENCNAYLMQQFIDAMPLYESAFSMVTLA